MAKYGTYADLGEFRTRLGITDTDDDTMLLHLLESVSRAVDRYCRRHFYVMTEARYLDGDAGVMQVVDRYTERVSAYLSRLWVADLLAVTSIKMDGDQDAVYEDTLAATDYILWPYVGYPKMRVDLDLRQGDYSYWYRGQKAIEITADWGYGNGEDASPVAASGATVTVADATATTVTVSDYSLLEPGQTILVGSERMYVRTVVDGDPNDSATVYRGVNGSTGAAQAAAGASIYQVPDDVREAVLIGTAKLWKRKDTAFATVVSSPELGQIEVMRGVLRDVDVVGLLSPYRRRLVGVV